MTNSIMLLLQCLVMFLLLKDLYLFIPVNKISLTFTKMSHCHFCYFFCKMLFE
jgi:hypothetical protein